VTLKTLKFSHPVCLPVRVILTIIRFIPQPHYAITVSQGSTLWCLLRHEAIPYVQGKKRLPFFFCGSSCSIPDHPCWICVGYCGIETGCSSSTVVYPFIIILIMFHTHLHLDTIPMRMRSGRSLGIFK